MGCCNKVLSIIDVNRCRKSTSKQSGSVPTQAPGLSSRSGGKSNDAAIDLDFEERLEAVRRTALEQKKSR